MEKREEVKNVVRQVDELLSESRKKDGKTVVTVYLLNDILAILVGDYKINKEELAWKQND